MKKTLIGLFCLLLTVGCFGNDDETTDEKTKENGAETEDRVAPVDRNFDHDVEVPEIDGFEIESEFETPSFIEVNYIGTVDIEEAVNIFAQWALENGWTEIESAGTMKTFEKEDFIRRLIVTPLVVDDSTIRVRVLLPTR